MEQALHDAMAELKAAGLHVSAQDDSLWIAATMRECADGVLISRDASCLLKRGDQWIAVYPAEGMLTYEVSGTLPELLALATEIYRRYRAAGGSLANAFRGGVEGPERYLTGRPPATNGSREHHAAKGAQEGQFAAEGSQRK